MSLAPARPGPRVTEAQAALASRVASWWDHARSTDAFGEFAQLRRIGRDVQASGRLEMGSVLRTGCVGRLFRLVAPLEQDSEVWTLARGRSVTLTCLVLAHVTEAKAQPMGEVLRGLRGPASSARVADSRVRGFLCAESTVEVLRRSLELLRMLSGAAPVGELGAALLLWSHDPALRKDWAETYYGLRDAGGPALRSRAAT